MPFSENLRNARKRKNLSQEQLAELLNVSRQSVSKWEQGNGYPETEKLIQIANILEVSSDLLLFDKQPSIEKKNAAFSSERKIAIRSYDGKMLSAFYKFTISPIAFAAKDEPKCILMGTDKSGFFGDNLVSLGWYANKDDAQKEITEIYTAMENGETAYTLKYYAKVKKKAFGVKLVNNSGE